MCIVSINVNDYFGIFTKTNLLKEVFIMGYINDVDESKPYKPADTSHMKKEQECPKLAGIEPFFGIKKQIYDRFPIA